MQEYKKLLEELKMFLNREKVDETEEVISAYNLYKSINPMLEELRKISDIQFLFYELNDMNTIFKRIIKATRMARELRDEDRIYLLQYAMSDENKSAIVIESVSAKSFYHLHYHAYSEEYTLTKDKKNGLIHFDDRVLNEKIMNNCHKKMMYCFSVLENAYDLFGEDIKVSPIYLFNNTYSDQIKCVDSNISLKIILKTNGEFDMIISAAPEEVYEKKLYNYQPLYDFVNNNKDEFLKRIPINISELNHIMRNIYEQSIKKENKKLIR